LEEERDKVDLERALLEKAKSEAEQPEKEAKERHEKAWEGVLVVCVIQLITCGYGYTYVCK